MVDGQDVVVLAGFGGPESMADIEPFLRSILAGRPIPAERMANMVTRYESVNGYSPFCAEVRSFAERLETLLVDTGVELPVWLTYLHRSPQPEELAQSLSHTAIRRVYVQVLTPFGGYEAYDKYVERLVAAFRAVESNDFAPELRFLPVLCEDPVYVETMAQHIVKHMVASESVKSVESIHLNSRSGLLFTAHSVPIAMRGREQYEREMERTVAAIVERMAAQSMESPNAAPWWDHNRVRIAWQSRSGRPDQPWLGPSPVEVVRQERGSWFVVPIGFLFENLELTYDLDQEVFAAISERPSDRYIRLPAVGSQSGMVRVVAKKILSEIMRGI